jgi:cob(I)alamin adenosyltransferase
VTTFPAVTAITGGGKGKTTTALGIAFSVFWEGGRVLIVQFLKGTGYTGELWAAQELGERIQIRQFGAACQIQKEIRSGQAMCSRCGKCFRDNRNPENDYAGMALSFVLHEAETGNWNLIVLDEISHSLNRCMIAADAVQKLLQDYRKKIRFVLTGRNMPQSIQDNVDFTIECIPVKHPISQGIWARRGIEY